MPTTYDTFSIEVSFELTSSSKPSNSDEKDIKNAIASSLGIDLDNIKDFTLTYEEITVRRRLQAKSYRWVVTFTVATTVAEVEAAGSSQTDFTSSIATTLASDSFTQTVVADTGAAVDTSSITTVALTRNPSAAPTSSSNKKDSSMWTPGVIAGVAIGATCGFLILVGGSVVAFMFCCKKKTEGNTGL